MSFPATFEDTRGSVQFTSFYIHYRPLSLLVQSCKMRTMVLEYVNPNIYPCPKLSPSFLGFYIPAPLHHVSQNRACKIPVVHPLPHISSQISSRPRLWTEALPCYRATFRLTRIAGGTWKGTARDGDSNCWEYYYWEYIYIYICGVLLI